MQDPTHREQVNCGAQSPGRYRCTSPAGHGGEHVALDSLGVHCETWSQADGARAAHREQVIAGLRELAQFLQDHPDLPAPYSVRVQIGDHELGTDRSDDAACRAAVDAAAVILNRNARQNAEHYETERMFGPSVTLGVVHIPAAAMAAWHALNSYGDNFRPAPARAARAQAGAS